MDIGNRRDIKQSILVSSGAYDLINCPAYPYPPIRNPAMLVCARNK